MGEPPGILPHAIPARIVDSVANDLHILERSRVLLSIALCLAVACSAAPPPLPIETDVCEIVGAPQRFVSRRVALDTSISADGLHLSLLMGPSCDRGIRFRFASTVPRNTQDRITDAIFQPWPGTSGKSITGRFEGTVRYDRSERLFPYSLEVVAVHDLEIEIGRRPW